MGRRKTKFRIKRMVTERRLPRPTQVSVPDKQAPETTTEDVTNSSTSGFIGKAKIIRNTDGTVGMAMTDPKMAPTPKKKNAKKINVAQLAEQYATEPPPPEINPNYIPPPPEPSSLSPEALRAQIDLMLSKMDEVVGTLMASYGPVIDPNLPLFDQHSHFIQMRQNMMVRPSFVPSPSFYQQARRARKVFLPNESISEVAQRRFIASYPCQFPSDPLQRKQFIFHRMSTVVLLKDLEKSVRAWYSLEYRLSDKRIMSWTNMLDVRTDLAMLLEKVMLIQHISRVRQYLSERKAEVELFAYCRNVRVEIAGGEQVGPPQAPLYPRKPILPKIVRDLHYPSNEPDIDKPLTSEERELALNYRVKFVFLFRNMASQNSTNVNFWVFVEDTIDQVLATAGVSSLHKPAKSNYVPRAFFVKTLEIVLRVQALVEASFMMNSRCLAVDVAKEDIMKFSTYLFDLTGGDTSFPVVVPPQTFDPPVFALHQNAPYLFEQEDPIPTLPAEDFLKHPTEAGSSSEESQSVLTLASSAASATGAAATAAGLATACSPQPQGSFVINQFENGIPPMPVNTVIVVQENKSIPYGRMYTAEEHIHYMDIHEYAAYLQERQRLGLPMHWEIDLKVLFDGLSLHTLQRQMEKYNLQIENIGQVQRLYHLQQIQQMQMQYMPQSPYSSVQASVEHVSILTPAS